MASDRPRRSRPEIINLASPPERYSPRRKMRQVLSQPPIQDLVFGDNSHGGLTWEDYSNLQPYIGPVLREQGRSIEALDQTFPLRCLERRTDENGDEYQCNQQADEDCAVRRCVGAPADQGAIRGQRNPDFPGNVRLRYQRPGDNLKKWDTPQEMLEHKRPSHPVCEECKNLDWRLRIEGWVDQWPHDSAHPDSKRWFRLCKKHTTVARTQGFQRRSINLHPICDCAGTSRQLWSCDNCQDEAQNAWDDRAQHWRQELLHTHKKQGRGKRPYVDWNKPPRAQPPCAWKNCGARGWYGTWESGRRGLSVCLACSSLVVA
ncbi:MAG: hypothetical protein LQ338_004072 [Usnochroma carphineum]|nr:MAG: hypothetical protein LQ338_004072 [Usnochroma carphineum]